MRYLFAFALLLLSLSTFAQKQYKDSLYNYKKIEKTTFSFQTVNQEELAFDYYRSPDAKGQLPLVVYVHGGGFSMGERDNKGIQFFAKRLASRGYAVASVSYRLTMKDRGFGCDISANDKVKAINDASDDILAAVKTILNDQKVFDIDPKKVVLMGSSAGAETVLNMAFLQAYQDSLPEFKYAGVISMAGAMIDVSAINVDNAIPTQLFHGTGDGIVPYGVAAHHFCSGKDPGYLMLYGSGSIAERLKGIGVSYYLYSVLGGAHEWAGKPTQSCFEEIIDFLYNDVVLPQMTRQTERTIRLQ